jgi:hypothetical protein
MDIRYEYFKMNYSMVEKRKEKRRKSQDIWNSWTGQHPGYIDRGVKIHFPYTATATRPAKKLGA